MELAMEQAIPYRSVLLDSWWYYKGDGLNNSEQDGTKNWYAAKALRTRHPISL